MPQDRVYRRSEQRDPSGYLKDKGIGKFDMDLDLHATSHRNGIYAHPPFKKEGSRPGLVIAGGMGG